MEHTTALAELLAAHSFRRHHLTKNRVGHFQIVGHLGDRAIDILVDTGAASTVVDLNYCREHQIQVRDTGRLGGGAGGVHLAIYTLGDISLSLDGVALRSDGIYAVDLTQVNQGLAMKGAERVHAVLGADVLTHHQAVIDYATQSLYLRHLGDGAG